MATDGTKTRQRISSFFWTIPTIVTRRGGTPHLSCIHARQILATAPHKYTGRRTRDARPAKTYSYNNTDRHRQGELSHHEQPPPSASPAERQRRSRSASGGAVESQTGAF